MKLIRNIFAPKWKHSNPKVRREAISEISDFKLLKEIILSDPDYSVKKESLRKINHKKELIELLTVYQNEDDLLKKMKEKFGKIYYDQILDALSSGQTFDDSYLKYLDDKKLQRLMQQISNNEGKKKIIVQIRDEKFLYHMAETNCGSELGEFITNKISNVKYLQRLAKQGGNKKVRNKASEKLEVILNEGGEITPEIQKERAEKLCKRLEEVIESKHWEEMEGHLEEISEAWNKLKMKETHPLYHRFFDLKKELTGHMERFSYVKKKMKELLCDLEKINKDTSIREGEKEFEKIYAEYKKLGKEHLVAEESEKFEEIYNHLKRKFEIESKQKELEVLEEKEKVKYIKNLLTEAESLMVNFRKIVKVNPIDFIKKYDKIESAWDEYYFESDFTTKLKSKYEIFISKLSKYKQQTLDIIEKEKEQDDLLNDLCTKLENLTASSDKDFDRRQQAKELQHLWKKERFVSRNNQEKYQQRFKMACDRFYAKQGEIKEDHLWNGWFKGQKTVDLIKEMDQIVNRSSLEGMAHDIMKLQQEAKKLHVPKREALRFWNEFNEKAGIGLEKCLKKKEEIFESLKEVLTPIREIHNDDELDKVNFKNVGNEVKNIQKEWNLLGNIPKKMGEKVYKEFFDECKYFFDRRQIFWDIKDGLRLSNLAAKKKIVENSEKIVKDRNLDSLSKMKKIQELQKKWKKIGPIPLSEGNDLWEKFQSICSSFFASLEKEKEENYIEKEKLCNEALEWLQIFEADEKKQGEVAFKLDNLQKKWQNIGPVPKDKSDEIWKRFYIPIKKFFDKRKQDIEQNEKEIHKKLLAKKSLIRKLEDAIIEFEEIDIASFESHWSDIGAIGGKDDQFLSTRFSRLIKIYNEEKNNHSTISDEQRNKNLQWKKELCQRLEVIVKLVYPDIEYEFEDDSDVNVMLDLGLKYKQVIVGDNILVTLENARNELRHIQNLWDEIGSVPMNQRRNLWNHYRKLTDILTRD